MTNNWIVALEADRHYARAVQARRELLLVQRKEYASDDLRLAEALALLGSTLLNAQQSLEAETAMRESLTIRTKKEADAWTTFDAQSMLGAALMAQEKYAEAEPFLVTGYEGMKQRQVKIRAEARGRMSEALERLVQLYDATGKKDEAAKRRKELEAAKAASQKKSGPR
jgi:hypothetical protein